MTQYDDDRRTEDLHDADPDDVEVAEDVLDAFNAGGAIRHPNRRADVEEGEHFVDADVEPPQ
jgi:hypothetical protein